MRASRRSRTSVETLLPAVGNLAGVLVIVGLVLTARARSIPPPPPAESGPEETAELDARRASVVELEGKIEGALAEAQDIENRAVARLSDRAALEAAVRTAQQELAERRGALDARTREQFDLAHNLTQARAELARLNALEAESKTPPKRVTQVQNYPTPISHSVNGRELHFQLKNGLVCYVPFEELLRKFKDVVQSRLWRIEGEDQAIDTVGPVDGFNLKYTLERQEMDYETARAAGRRGAGSFINVTHFEFLPVSDGQGETLEQALAPTSQFRGRLDGLRPDDVTVTMWIYPDSFELFRGLRAEMYKLGFPIAGRPLPDGTSIGASPGGSKSSAE